MRIFLGALACWAGFHREHWMMTLTRGVLPICKRCGRSLVVVVR